VDQCTEITYGNILSRTTSIRDVRILMDLTKARLSELEAEEDLEWTIKKVWILDQVSNSWSCQKGFVRFLGKPGRGYYPMHPTRIDDCDVKWFPCKLYADEFLANMKADTPQSFDSKFAKCELVSRKKKR